MTTVMVEVTRGGIVECRHYGAVAVADAAGRLLFSAGDPRLVTFFRSAAKPIQAVPLVLGGTADRFGFTDEELAICTASHSGEPVHRATVAGMLEKVGLDEGALQCGVVPPIDRAEAARVLAGLLPRGPLYNDCSGKHTGMLAGCRHRGFPIDSYLAADHPWQREILAVMGEFLGLDPASLPLAPDGCGVPTFAAPLASIARAWARLAAPPAPYAAVAGRILDAMAAHPYMVAGRGRLDTDLMEVAAGAGGIVAKGGAEGVLCLALRERGWGVAIKVEDGNGRALPAVAAAVLSQLGALDDAALARFVERQPPVVRNKDGAAAGELRPVVALAPTPSHATG